MEKLTKAQSRFLWASAHECGCDPIWYDHPLRNDQLRPLIDRGLVQRDNDAEVWRITPAGRAAIQKESGDEKKL